MGPKFDGRNLLSLKIARNLEVKIDVHVAISV